MTMTEARLDPIDYGVRLVQLGAEAAKWKARNRVGDRVPWYELPEDPDRAPWAS
jgi:hypothetical protein